MNTSNKLSTREKVAATISVGVLLAMIVYWITQIVGVMEMLKLAYG